VGTAKPALRLSPSNTFKLAIFADLHYGEDESGWGIDQDVNSTRVMRAVLGRETPDLVVVNGDLITGENTFRENSSAYVHRVVAPMVERGVPWASTYGNHDSKFNLSREAMYATEKTYALSYTQRMDPSLPGITNYYLLLRSAAGRRPVAVLWFFDSRGGATYQDPSAIAQDDIPNWVANQTAAWFARQSAELRARHGPLPSLAFVHIPPHVFLGAQQSGLNASRFPGVNDDVPAAIQGQGTDDQAFVDALLAEDRLHSVYVGHDHGDAWCAPWPAAQTRRGRHAGGKPRRPVLCFSKHTGYGGYGTWNRGARVVNLAFVGNDSVAGEMQVETWVRMENGDVVTRVMLNETYGMDVYPTADGE
jgi:hypothetical protein